MHVFGFVATYVTIRAGRSSEVLCRVISTLREGQTLSIRRAKFDIVFSFIIIPPLLASKIRL